MPMTEDATAFLQTTEFATAATFDTSTTVNGILDTEYTEFGEDVASTNPMFTCALADVTSVANAKDKNLVIGSITYVIRNPRPDPNGFMVDLELEQQGSL